MSIKCRYHYFVEGECERQLIETLKSQKTLLLSGKVDVFNPVIKPFTQLHLRSFRQNTVVVLVFDTDTEDPSLLKSNISFLRSGANVKDVWCIPQVRNLEDELLRSTDLKSIRKLVNAPTIKEFKHFFIKEKNLYQKLESHCFDLMKIWATKPQGYFSEIENDGRRIKLVSVKK